jgi:hypothetical protein
VRVYTYTEARQNLASVLNHSQREGPVRIRRKDGRPCVVRPDPSMGSPLDVEGVDLGIASEEIVAIVRKERER